MFSMPAFSFARTYQFGIAFVPWTTLVIKLYGTTAFSSCFGYHSGFIRVSFVFYSWFIAGGFTNDPYFLHGCLL